MLSLLAGTVRGATRVSEWEGEWQGKNNLRSGTPARNGQWSEAPGKIRKVRATTLSDSRRRLGNF